MMDQGDCSSKCEKGARPPENAENAAEGGQVERPIRSEAVPELSQARAVVAFQPDTQDREPIHDAAGWTALHDLVAAAFGDASAFQASIPAQDDDTDLVVGRWVRQVVAERDALRASGPERERPDPKALRMRVDLSGILMRHVEEQADHVRAMVKVRDGLAEDDLYEWEDDRPDIVNCDLIDLLDPGALSMLGGLYQHLVKVKAMHDAGHGLQALDQLFDLYVVPEKHVEAARAEGGAA